MNGDGNMGMNFKIEYEVKTYWFSKLSFVASLIQSIVKCIGLKFFMGESMLFLRWKESFIFSGNFKIKIICGITLTVYIAMLLQF